MGIYEDLLARDAKLIPGGAAQNTARGAQVGRNHSQHYGCGSMLTIYKVHASRQLGRLHWLHW